MLKYPCLVLDHDDTVVQSEASVNFPCFCRFLEIYRPGITISLEEYVEGCSNMNFDEMCRTKYSLNEAEMAAEYRFWKEYTATHIPKAYDGMAQLLQDYRQAGGKICVASMSSQEIILRDYHHHYGLEPDIIFDCNLPEGQRKPSSWAISQIRVKYGFTPDEILVVDDMKFAVRMAREAGCPIAFAGWGRKDFQLICNEMTELCDYTFYSVAELRYFLLCEDGRNEA